MNIDSGFDDKEFTATPYLKLIEDKAGGTCMCYQMRLLGKLHFVKKIRPEFENDARMRAAFRKENEIGFSLSHPNLPKYVFMEGIFSPEEYVVTEWIDGFTLDKFIENHPLFFSDKRNSKRFIYQLTEALDYLHQHGIIHRDLKPSNIMLSRDGEKAILLDLGYSISDAHNLTGGFTHDFASPELITEKSLSKADDFYSLGKIIEFIENHTQSKLTKEIITLKAALTNTAISLRIHTKEEIYKILEKKRGKWVWLAGLPSIGLLVWFIMATINNDSTYQIDKDINQPAIAKEEINEYQTSIPVVEEHQFKDTIYGKNENKVNVGKAVVSKIDIETEKEKIKEEVKRLLKLNYAPCINRIDSLTEANDFTLDWYIKIYNESAEAIPKSIKDIYYYEKYPMVPKDEVIFILSTEFSNFCNNIWNPKIENYYKNIPK